MGATSFICPNGSKTKINVCLNQCQSGQRCMFLPTLRAVAESLDRKIEEPTVTELLCGTRETYLKRPQIMRLIQYNSFMLYMVVLFIPLTKALLMVIFLVKND